MVTEGELCQGLDHLLTLTRMRLPGGPLHPRMYMLDYT